MASHEACGRGVFARDEVHETGQHPEGDRNPESDQGVALARGEPAELAAFLVDVLVGAGDAAHLRAVEENKDHAEGQEHQETYGECRYGPLEEGDGRPRLVLDETDTDEVRWATDRRNETAHAGAVGDHEHQSGAETEAARVPLALGLFAHQAAQSSHYSQSYREEHRSGGSVRDKGANRSGDGAEGYDDAVGGVAHPRDGEHPEGEPPVESVGHHSLGDDKRPNEQEDRVGREGSEDGLRPSYPEEHASCYT